MSHAASCWAGASRASRHLHAKPGPSYARTQGLCPRTQHKPPASGLFSKKAKDVLWGSIPGYKRTYWINWRLEPSE